VVERSTDAVKELTVHGLLPALATRLVMQALSRGMRIDDDLAILGRAYVEDLGLAAIYPDNGVPVLAHVMFPSANI
jgi:hypothetical protein